MATMPIHALDAVDKSVPRILLQATSTDGWRCRYPDGLPEVVEYEARTGREADDRQVLQLGVDHVDLHVPIGRVRRVAASSPPPASRPPQPAQRTDDAKKGQGCGRPPVTVRIETGHQHTEQELLALRRQIVHEREVRSSTAPGENSKHRPAGRSRCTCRSGGRSCQGSRGGRECALEVANLDFAAEKPRVASAARSFAFPVIPPQ